MAGSSSGQGHPDRGGSAAAKILARRALNCVGDAKFQTSVGFVWESSAERAVAFPRQQNLTSPQTGLSHSAYPSAIP